MKKMIAVLLALTFVFALAACAGSSKPAETTAAAETTTTAAASETTAGTDTTAAASSDTTSAAAAGGTLTMATSADFPPYEFYDGDKIVGIDAEIAAAIAQKLGMELKIEDMDFDSVIPAIQSGKADIAMSGLTVTDERKLTVDFSDSYATGVQAIVVPEKSPITSADDLAKNVGKYKIGVQLATTGDIYASDTPEKGGFGSDNVEEYSKGADAILALTSGKIDAVIIDKEPAKAFVAANSGLKVLDSAYVSEDYAIAVQKGNTELLGKVNDALKGLIADGTVKSIVDKYITAK